MPTHTPLDPLLATDWAALSRLEDAEQELIKFGIYETYLAPSALSGQVLDEGGRPAPLDAIRAALDRLCGHFLAVRVGDDLYRSRISELVRLLKNLKQRFGPDDAGRAPFVVNSVRVEFRDRRRLLRSEPAQESFRRLFQDHRTLGLPHLDTARRVVLGGLADGTGSPVEDCSLTRVQERALQQVGGRYLRRDGRGFVITGNTGSGKTEAALLPLLVGAARERMGGTVGCKVMLVYPRQALARNQLDRLVRYVARVNQRIAGTAGRGVADAALSVGILYGDTPADDRELEQGGRYRKAWARRGDGFVLPYFATDDGDEVIATPGPAGSYTVRPGGGAEEWRLETFRATRRSILDTPPDVLILTTEMLHRWLSDPAANRLFGLPGGGHAAVFCPPRAVVFDEIHLYDTIHGAQVGMLIRRLRNRLFHALRAEGAGWTYPLVLGMSATIGDPAEFWRRLSGVPVVEPIVPEDEDFGEAVGRDYYLFVRPETYSRGKRVGDASAAIQTVMAIAHVMPRRAATDREPPKHRSLVFLDSIGKVRKLTVEFRDAETNLGLSRYRLVNPPPLGLASPEFADGEYWHFDRDDPQQYSERREPGTPPRSLTSSNQPVYSGTAQAAPDALQRDVVFATTALEVGYDDPSIQFVLQHHAPRTPASFIQKRGRAGRGPNDRPITAVTLSRLLYADAFYYQNPQLLYDPADYRPPLNVGNYFVQRFQSLALAFDELARVTGTDHARPRDGETTEAHLARADAAIRSPAVAGALDQAYLRMADEAFRRVHPDWRGLWDWLRGRLAELEAPVARARTLLERLPDLPRNLFGTINLPTVRVMFQQKDPDDPDWGDVQEDIALVLFEVTPGKVSRRYGPPWQHLLLWRPPVAWVGPTPASKGTPVQGAVAVERFKDRSERGQGPGPFDPARLEPADTLWETDWEQFLPERARQLYPDGLPDRFYRLRYVELFNFGTLNPDDPKTPQSDWHYVSTRGPDGSVRVHYDHNSWYRNNDPTTRQIAPDSTSYPLTFSVVRQMDPDTGRPTRPAARRLLPSLFPGLADSVECFGGEVEGERSVLRVHEAYFGAEAALKLVRRGNNDRLAAARYLDVRYVSEHDGRPTLFGHDLTTEGIRLGYDPARVEELAGSLWDHLREDPGLWTHAQDQFFRYLLKSRPWAVPGVADPLNQYDIRLVADLLATARAESRARGQSIEAFLTAVTAAGGLRGLVADYWRDHRLFADPDFVARLDGTLSAPAARDFLRGTIDRVTDPGEFRRFLGDVVLHSLGQSLRNLFIIEGCTRDEEVGVHGPLWLTHGRRPDDPALYVYERNQDGNGATRLLSSSLDRGPGYSLRRWWGCTLGCPVGDEEDFIRHMLRWHAAEFAAFRQRFEAAPSRSKPSPREMLERLSSGWRAAVMDDPAVGRLAGLLTGELTFAGECVAQLGLTTELLALEDELSGRFGRSPSPAELAGFAATRADRSPESVPHVRRLYDIYLRHTADLGWDADEDDGPEAANPLDRFLAQVEQLALLSCMDACPACLAGRSPHGAPEVTRHLTSRLLLRAAHRLLTRPLTRPSVGVPVAELVALASAQTWLVLEGDCRPAGETQRALKDAALLNVGDFVEFRGRMGPIFRQVWAWEVER